MLFDSDKSCLAETNKPTREPNGQVIIGQDNPIGMSMEDWQNNPNLLFHGASDKFEFKRDFDYKTELGSVHSHTVGRGFYATPDHEDASLYSRAFNGEKDPVVISLLPYQARMFDFRDQGLSTNAQVPNEMFHAYYNFYQGFFPINGKIMIPKKMTSLSKPTP